MSDVTCSGSCCAVFTLKTPIEEHYNEQIVGMAIPLTREAAEERRIKFGGLELPAPPDVESEWKYHTCRNWDEETRLCGIYEDRPTMCRDYPYDGACEHAGCTYCAPEEIKAKWREIRAKGAEVATPVAAGEVS